MFYIHKAYIKKRSGWLAALAAAFFVGHVSCPWHSSHEEIIMMSLVVDFRYIKKTHMFRIWITFHFQKNDFGRARALRAQRTCPTIDEATRVDVDDARRARSLDSFSRARRSSRINPSLPSRLKLPLSEATSNIVPRSRVFISRYSWQEFFLLHIFERWLTPWTSSPSAEAVLLRPLHPPAMRGNWLHGEFIYSLYSPNLLLC